MNLLEIKIDKIVNNCTGYGRMAVPVLYTWQWRQMALSDSREALEKYADALPIQKFYLRKRKYRITEQAVPAVPIRLQDGTAGEAEAINHGKKE